jgi:hypothetical protein
MKTCRGCKWAYINPSFAEDRIWCDWFSEVMLKKLNMKFEDLAECVDHTIMMPADEPIKCKCWAKKDKP